MFRRNLYRFLIMACILLTAAGCKMSQATARQENAAMPAAYNSVTDTVSIAKMAWKDYFKDPYLDSLIGIALQNNQELNITLQEIEVSRNEVRIRRGEYLPFAGLRAGAGTEKVGRYTRDGAVEHNLDIVPGKENPEPLSDFTIGAFANWELDIWRKLRNSKKAAVSRYLSSVEGRNFMVTNLVAEVANSYFELLALDNELEIINQNIGIQNNAFEIVKLQKESARVNELAVRRFEAQVLKTKSMQYAVRQKIIETENQINFLLGRFPQPIQRNSQSFFSLVPNTVAAGVPSQLLENRPDIKQAEYDLAAAKLDVKVARARFYPSLSISAGVGYRAFDASYLFKSPESLLYNVAGDLMAPLINRNAIKATYSTATAKQLQAVYNYEKTILNAYIEVVNQLSAISNLQSSYEFKTLEVEALTKSIDISNDLFGSARADYMEVLLTQRDALDSRFELIDTKKQQLNAMVGIYKALGGGWR